ncbi:MAG TPA: PLD nuclease N-terminal domain-containing protein [Thermohalobaculum sp.]|nr:PLD nuclease N-terminal domain-containing protein [Thermohalobaculum sp.]
MLGLLLLVGNVYAVVKTLQSPAETGAKVIWIVLIIVFPVIGLVLWLIFGPSG